MIKLKSLDVSPLQDIDLNYASQTSILPYKSDNLLACTIYYNFDLLSIIRYTGSNYTADLQDKDDIVDILTFAGCNESLVNDIKRITSVGLSSLS